MSYCWAGTQGKLLPYSLCYPGNGGVTSPSAMDHLSSTALELRSGAQERQGRHGYLALGGKVSREKDHTVYAILSWVPHSPHR